MKYLATLVLIFLPFIMLTQSSYQDGWRALDEHDIVEAIGYFEDASQGGESTDAALLMLSLLYPRVEKDDLGRKSFRTFYSNSADPIPASFALLFEESVLHNSALLSKENYSILQLMRGDHRHIGKTDGDLLYRSAAHRLFSFDKEAAIPYYDSLMVLDNWQFVGPFDNVMNSGYDKDFGALSFPGSDHEFKSKYGALVKWFDPEINITDGYLFKNSHFLSANSIIYAQCYILSEKDQDIFLKGGYSGSLKVWLNDQEIYREPSRRVTSNDYLQLKTELKEGWNRVLVQLGDFNESTPNFSFRITNRQHKPLSFTSKSKWREFSKEEIQSVNIQHFAVGHYDEMIKDHPEDRLARFLLYKSYMRMLELDKAEATLLSALEVGPDNYLFLRNAVLFTKYWVIPQNRIDITKNSKSYIHMIMISWLPKLISTVIKVISIRSKHWSKFMIKHMITLFNISPMQ